MIKPLDHDAHERERRTMHDNVVPLHSELGTPRRRTSLAPTPRPRFGAQSGRHDHIPCAQQYRDQNTNCDLVSRDLELLIGGELIEPSWRSIEKLVSELRDKRNTVAHGQLVWHNRL